MPANDLEKREKSKSYGEAAAHNCNRLREEPGRASERTNDFFALIIL